MLRELGELEAATSLQREALDALIRTLGADHPSTLSSQCNLALMLQDSGDLEAAKQLHCKAQKAAARFRSAAPRCSPQHRSAQTQKRTFSRSSRRPRLEAHRAKLQTRAAEGNNVWRAQRSSSAMY